MDTKTQRPLIAVSIATIACRVGVASPALACLCIESPTPVFAEMAKRAPVVVVGRVISIGKPTGSPLQDPATCYSCLRRHDV